MKAIGWIVGIVLLLVVGAGVFVFLNSGDLIKRAIEEVGPDYLGTSVNVDEVDLQVTEGAGAIRGLQVGNPSGFTGVKSMGLGEIEVVLDTSTLNSDVVVIKQININAAELYVVAQGKQTNLQKLMDNVTQATGGEASETVPEQDTTSETKFIVDQFTFNNAKVALNSDVLGEMDLSIPDITLTGIGRKTDGATAAELARELLKPISSAVSKAAVSQGLDLDGIKAQAKEKINEKIKEKLGGSLKGLLKRD